MMGGCIHGTELDHRCYQCEPETPAERRQKVADEARWSAGREHRLREKAALHRPSDLEQITRERDEAVGLLREIVDGPGTECIPDADLQRRILSLLATAPKP